MEDISVVQPQFGFTHFSPFIGTLHLGQILSIIYSPEWLSLLCCKYNLMFQINCSYQVFILPTLFRIIFNLTSYLQVILTQIKDRGQIQTFPL